jgi:beta-glucosidase
MTERVFPAGFLWGTATSAHQVEGNNANSDWWDWETRVNTPCPEPSGNAIEHYERYPADVTMLAGLGFNSYRFSVEWARIEPEAGRFDDDQLDHYRKMVATVREAGLIPIVTLHHFTVPLWVSAEGGWLSEQTPSLFERYVRRVVEVLGDQVDWYCTINEPGIVAYGGYLGGMPWPPGLHGLKNWQAATKGLIEGHLRARAAIKELRPGACVGMTHSMAEWESNKGGLPAMELARRMGEDVYFEACADDDFVGVQAYTRYRLAMPRVAGWVTRAALATSPTRRLVVELGIAIQRRAADRINAAAATGGSLSSGGTRRTQMGYEYRPEAVAATVRRAASLLPGKPIIVTESGVATADDRERVEFIGEALHALHAAISDGIPVRGYIYWSGFDNFEWSLGYGMTFGLIGVDRKTQVRAPKASAKFLGNIARSNKLATAE